RFQSGGVCLRRNLDGRRKNDYGTAERPRKQEVIPGLFERLAVLDADVKDSDGRARAAGEHHGARLRDIARAARAVNREGAVLPFLDALGHDGEAAKTSA